MSTKVFSIILFLICLLGIYYGLQITVDFSYEPVGPKPFPVGTLILIAFLSVVLFFFGHQIDIHWGEFAFHRKMVVFIGSFLIFAFGFEYFGFMIMSTFLAFCVAFIFGAHLKHAMIFAPCLGVSLYLIFDLLLEVTLPIGLIFI